MKSTKKTKKLALRFTRRAWGKLVYINELSTTEISGFCISNPNDLLLVEDIAFLQQVNTAASTLLDDEAVADYFDDQVDKGRKPHEFARIWLHTHPNGVVLYQKKANLNSYNRNLLTPSPSQIDEDTIQQAFRECDWAVMFIYSGGDTGYARLVVKKPFLGHVILPVEVLKKGKYPTKKDFQRWSQEFYNNVTVRKLKVSVNEIDVVEIDDDERELFERYLGQDIDTVKFASYLAFHDYTVMDFCGFENWLRQFWMDEFRKERKTQALIKNSY